MLAVLSLGLMSSTLLSIYSTKLLKSVFNLSPTVSALVTIGLIVFGFLASLYLSLAFSPNFVRLGFMARNTGKTLSDFLPKNSSQLKNLTKVEIFEINDEDFQNFGKNVVVAGLYLPTLGFYPKVFASKTVTDKCSNAEWIAILAHEWGHIEKSHLKKRLIEGIKTFSLSAVFTICILLGFQWSGYRELHSMIVLTAGFIPSLMTWFRLQKLLTEQEIEADEFAKSISIQNKTHLLSALKKLTHLNEYRVQPLVHQRIKRLEKDIAA